MKLKAVKSIKAPQILENPAGKGIVVFIHGFMGNPRQFGKYAEVMYRLGYSVFSLLLPGHGGTSKDFASGTFERWQNHVNSEIEAISRNHSDIWIAGHSMGGLLAVNAAVKFYRHVRGIFLIACPFKVKVFSLYAMKVRIRLIFSRKDDPKKAAYRDASSLSPSLSLVWRAAGPVAELRKLIRAAKRNLEEIRTPVTAVYSTADELISMESLDILKSGLLKAPLKQVLLSDSLHAYYPEHEMSVIERNLIKMPFFRGEPSL